MHSIFFSVLKIRAVNFLEFTAHVSEEAFAFGGRKCMLFDMSGFAVIVYNVSNKFNHEKKFFKCVCILLIYKKQDAVR